MATDYLTAEELRKVLRYDEQAGMFRWRVTSSNRAVSGAVAGHADRSGYVSIRVRGRLHLAHRLAWLFVFGVWPTGMLDHINGVKSDNRIANLRECSNRTNTENARKPRPNGCTGFLGVTMDKRLKSRPFIAQITADGRRMHIGCFESAEAAHAAYLVAKRRLHRGCTI